MSIYIRDYAATINGRKGVLSVDAVLPFTDDEMSFSNAHRLVPDYGTQSALSVEVGGLFPAPRGDVMLVDLIEFRRRYSDERQRLIVSVEVLLHRFSTNFNHPSDVFKSMKLEIESAVNDIRSAARSRGLALATRSLAVSIALGAGAIAMSVPTAAWTLGVISNVAINAATTEHRSRWSGKEFSYLYLVSQLTNEANA